MTKRGRPKGSKNKTTIAAEKAKQEVVEQSKGRSKSLPTRVRVKGFRASEDLKDWLATHDEELKGIILDIVLLKDGILKVGTIAIDPEGDEIRTVITDDITDAGFHVILAFKIHPPDTHIISKLKQVLDQL